jgi:hypothetical protein
MNARELTPDERQRLIWVLDRSEPTLVDLWGEGEHRTLSFFAQGTRLEARVPLPAS